MNTVTLCPHCNIVRHQRFSQTPRTLFALRAYPSVSSEVKSHRHSRPNAIVIADTLHVSNAAVDVADEAVNQTSEASGAGERALTWESVSTVFSP
jgi:hypothetical protein